MTASLFGGCENAERQRSVFNLIEEPMALKVATERKPGSQDVERKAAKGENKRTAEAQQEAKTRFLKYLKQGNSIQDSIALAGRSKNTYTYWRKSDPDFRHMADRIRGRLPEQEPEHALPDFPEFCEEYLGWRLYRHQLQWFDALEGREPRNLHPAQSFEQGRQTHMIINTPPYHGKTSTISVAYVLWKILKDPTTLVMLISKKQQMAGDMLYQIKDFLTNPAYEKLQLHFGPPEGFEEACPIWTATRFYFGPKLRQDALKDPTVQALGMHGQIYGTRSDLIILDDCIEPDNAHEYEKQINWLSRVILTRPGRNGTVLVVGTRVAPVDLYGELRKPQYSTGKKAWTYFAQPAVEEFADSPVDWKTLWPKSNRPQSGDEDLETDSNGEFPAWDGPALSDMRDIISQVDNNAWAQGYQQEQVSELAVFPRDDVFACVNDSRAVGRLVGQNNMTGKYVIAGLDPASAGHTAAVCIAVDMGNQKRYVLDVHNQPAMTPDQVRWLLLSWTQKYRISEWRVEKVLLSNWITQDQQIMRQLANHGTTMSEHHTGKNKWDVDAGVMSLASLFRSRLIELPTTQNETIRNFCEQLVTYFPETKGKTDMLMALWFAEIRAREVIQAGTGGEFMQSEWLSDRDIAAQVIIDLAVDDGPQKALWWS